MGEKFRVFLGIFGSPKGRCLGTFSSVGIFIGLFLLIFLKSSVVPIDYSFRDSRFQEMAAESINASKNRDVKICLIDILGLIPTACAAPLPVFY